MEITDININSSDDNIIAIIDGVVYAKGQRGRPRNPLRWREDGKYLSSYLDRDKRLEYNEKLKVLKVCEFCGKEQQILHFKRHLNSAKCKTLKEIKEAKEKLLKFETATN